MRKLLFAAMISASLFSCKREQVGDKNNYSPAASTWKLTETLADPGDGSGTFTAVESDKTIAFYSNGTISCSGSLCDMTIASGNPTTGTYSIADSTISSADCNGYVLHYSENGAALIINYPCIEPCRAKYVRVE